MRCHHDPRYQLGEGPDPTLCVLCVVAAHPGGLTLEVCGTLFGLTRERIRQVEEHALERLARALDRVDGSMGAGRALAAMLAERRAERQRQRRAKWAA